MYSSPRDIKQSFKSLLTKAANLAKDAPLLIGGDFNAPHYAWKYVYSAIKGERLWQQALDLNLSLITDPSYPTRCGTSTCRDSTPDLTFVRGVQESSWSNSNTDFGSDHYILMITLVVANKKRSAHLGSLIGMHLGHEERRESVMRRER